MQCLIILYDLKLGEYGLLGDAVGGILGTVVGIVTIFFLYKTYDEQRRAGKAQEDALKEQRGYSLYNEIRLLIKDVKNQFDQLSIVEGASVHNGQAIINSYVDRYIDSVNPYMQSLPYLHPQQKKFLNNLLRVYNRLSYLVNFFDQNKYLIQEQYCKNLETELENLKQDYVIDITKLFFRLQLKVENETNTTNSTQINAALNLLMHLIRMYQSTSQELVNSGYLVENRQPIFDVGINNQIDEELKLSIRFNVLYQ
jgi:hypothetical protein